MDSDSDDGAGAANTMDLTRIKSQMPKKVFKSEHIDTCDPAVLLNAQLFESIGVDDNDSVRGACTRQWHQRVQVPHFLRVSGCAGVAVAQAWCTHQLTQ